MMMMNWLYERTCTMLVYVCAEECAGDNVNKIFTEQYKYFLQGPGGGGNQSQFASTWGIQKDICNSPHGQSHCLVTLEIICSNVHDISLIVTEVRKKPSAFLLNANHSIWMQTKLLFVGGSN